MLLCFIDIITIFLMEITWHGGNAIRLSDGKVTLMVDPDLAEKKISDPEKIDFAVSTRAEHAIVSKEKKVFDWPGEYEIKGASFVVLESEGIGSPLGYRFMFPDSTVVAVIGRLNGYPTDAFVEQLGDVHVLVLDLGSDAKGSEYSPKEAYRLVEAVEPAVVIPVGWKDGSGAFSAFLKEVDVPMPEVQKKFSFKKASLNKEALELVVLQN